MADEELRDGFQFPTQRLGSELAEGVARVGLGRAAQRADTHATGKLVGEPQGGRGNLGSHLVAIGALGP